MNPEGPKSEAGEDGKGAKTRRSVDAGRLAKRAY